MIQKLKLTILAMLSIFTAALPLAISGVAVADVTQQNINQQLCSGSNINLDTANPTNCPKSSGSTATDLVKKVINILSVVVGAVAVIMLIVGGFRYITSGGKQESVTAAKNTILYALIGLVIVAVAQVVVHFVLNNTTDAVNGK